MDSLKVQSEKNPLRHLKEKYQLNFDEIIFNFEIRIACKKTFEIGNGVTIGPGKPLTLLAGPCVLEDEANIPLANLGQLALGVAGNVLAGKLVAATVGRIEHAGCARNSRHASPRR